MRDDLFNLVQKGQTPQICIFGVENLGRDIYPQFDLRLMLLIHNNDIYTKNKRYWLNMGVKIQIFWGLTILDEIEEIVSQKLLQISL